MIDLTKPLHVKLDDEYNSYFEVVEFFWDPVSGDAADDFQGINMFSGNNAARVREPYRRLFEAAPKMLAMLKRIDGMIAPGRQLDQVDIKGLIEEIEGVPSTVHPVMGSRKGSSITTTNIRPAPPLGDIGPFLPGK